MTKEKWKDKSKISYIKKGMKDLLEQLLNTFDTDAESDWYIKIAFPKIGCGLGGLNWEEVKYIIEEGMRNIDAELDAIRGNRKVDWFIYE